MPTTSEITTWQQFAAEVRQKQHPLLLRLDAFRESILVTGCQRSGTTMLAGILLRSDGMVNYVQGKDEELDGALILAGQEPQEPRGRYCFQTTYLNERFPEYFTLKKKHYMIWVLRNPASVVYSMLHNWKDFALRELFDACGAPLLSPTGKLRYQLFGDSDFGIDRLEQACLSYNGKLSQLPKLHGALDNVELMVVDYDDLVERKTVILPAIYAFVGLPYREEYADVISPRSTNKWQQLSTETRAYIEATCRQQYLDSRKLCTPISS